MLTQQATEFLIKLCESQPDDKYIVKEWDEIYSVYPLENKKDNEELWKQLKINACVDIKYCDDEEACFAITNKARLIVDDYKVVEAEASSEDAIVKTDSLGRAVVVLPKGKTFENAIKSKKTRLKSILYGLLGGFIGGLIGGSIMYSIFNFMGV